MDIVALIFAIFVILIWLGLSYGVCGGTVSYQDYATTVGGWGVLLALVEIIRFVVS